MASVAGTTVVDMEVTAAAMVATAEGTAAITGVTTAVIIITTSKISDDSFRSEMLGGLFLPGVPIAECNFQSRLKSRPCSRDSDRNVSLHDCFAVKLCC